MTEYIYIVKCPGCEDEMFNFFTDARMQCDLVMSKHPIITQVEVERNDFGECTDHHDLGTVWSWEEAMKDTEGGYTDAEPAKSIFTKDDLKDYIPDSDPEFDNIDNSVDFDIEEPVTSEVSSTERKPIPDGMTIEQLVEEMEENEDTVECAGCEELFPKDECVHKEGIGYLCGDCEDSVVKCTWCEELYDKSECRKEVDLGWLCSRCEQAIKSRGETLTFREGSYWDFLDEDIFDDARKAALDATVYAPDKYYEFEFTHDDSDYGELEVVFHESYADILEALKEIVDDDYVRELSDEDEPQTEAEWKAAGKWDEFFTVDITTHISNLYDELVEYFEEDREAAIKEARSEAEEDYKYSDGPGGGAFTSWDDFWRWKEG